VPISTVKRPYELLVRWKDGVIAGAHVGFELTTTEDDVILSTTPLPVMAVDLGQGAGFPLADILEQVQIDAIISMDAANASRAQAESQLSAAEAAIAELQAAATAAQNAIAVLTAKVAEIESAQAPQPE
jgi:hypothetical protein